MERENDFSQGSIAKNILNLAVPMTLAQLINVLYSVVDRVYIGHLQGVSANALTGIGLALPIITIITAFANLFGMGGAPLCSIARGSHEEEKAEKVMGNSCSMLLFTGGLLMGICLIFRKRCCICLERAVRHFRMQTHTSVSICAEPCLS